jgi:ABC-type nitrate/sulfonate/bicarbonate transport system substrate-binding protein
MQWTYLKTLVLGATLAIATNAAFAADPVTIHFGRQTAAEDNLWLMIAKPELSTNLNKAYKIEWNQFRASDVAFKAFEAGQVDLVSTSINAAITAAAAGVDFKLVASLSRESQNGANTKFPVKLDGPKTIADLKGKIIGIVGQRSSVQLWAREAVRTGGLDPDKDVLWAVIPFPAVADAVRVGTITTGGIPDLFATGELAKGDLRVLFTSKTGIPFDEELIGVLAAPDFIKKQPAAVRAFLADLKATTQYFLAHLQESRQALLDAKLVLLPPAVYLALPEYVRDPELRPNLENLTKQQDVLVSSGFVEKKIDLTKVVDTSFLPAP